MKLRTAEAAEYVSQKTNQPLSTSTFHRWRTKRVGPRWFQVGQFCLYDTDDLDKWIESCAIEPDGIGVRRREKPAVATTPQQPSQPPAKAAKAKKQGKAA
jgi:hypothetical protein